MKGIHGLLDEVLGEHASCLFRPKATRAFHNSAGAQGTPSPVMVLHLCRLLFVKHFSLSGILESHHVLPTRRRMLSHGNALVASVWVDTQKTPLFDLKDLLWRFYADTPGETLGRWAYFKPPGGENTWEFGL